VVACMFVYGGMRVPVPSSRGSLSTGIRPEVVAVGQFAMACAEASPESRGEGARFTVGCVWQSAYPPDGRFSDARVHHRFSPRHRKPSRLVRIARATAPPMVRLWYRLFFPEMQPDNI